MILEVDQSIKIEQTNADTVLALSNDETFAVRVPADVKRECLAVLRRRGERRKAITLKVFSAALFLLLQGHLARAERIVIDTEYPGREGDIQGMLMNWIRKRRPGFDPTRLVFARVGKRSRAHRKAARVGQGRDAADTVLTTRRLLRLL